MSKSAKGKAKRIFAALLVGLLLVGTAPLTPMGSLVNFSITAKAVSDKDLIDSFSCDSTTSCVIARFDPDLIGNEVPSIYAWDSNGNSILAGYGDQKQMERYNNEPNIFYCMVSSTIYGLRLSKTNLEPLTGDVTLFDEDHPVGYQYYILDITKDETTITPYEPFEDTVQLEQDDEGNYYCIMPIEYTGVKKLDLSDKDDGFTFHLYDDGGKSDPYSSSLDCPLIITAPENFRMSVEGKASVEKDSDFLKIFDGDNKNAKILSESPQTYLTENKYDINCISSTNNLLVYFSSDQSLEYDGFDLKITLQKCTPHQITVKETTGGTVSASLETATEGRTVDLSINTDNGYQLKELLVKDADNNPVKVTDGHWYSGSTASFVMPATAVTVTPVFVESSSGELYIDLASSGTTEVVIPNGVTSFKIYDDGGNDGAYSYYSKALTIQAPEGHLIEISGKYNIYNTWLILSEPGKTLANYYSADISEYFDVPLITTTGNKLTVELNCLYTPHGDGIDLSTTYNISFASAEHGSVSCTDPITCASYNDEVALTVKPDEGYMLESLVVEDKFGDQVKLTGGKWFSRNTSFLMPSSDVTVKAIFSDKHTAQDGLTVSLPLDNDEELYIPEMVTSFRLSGTLPYNDPHVMYISTPEGTVIRAAGTFSCSTNDFNYDFCALEKSGSVPVSKEQKTDQNENTYYEAVLSTSTNNSLEIDYNGYQSNNITADLTVEVLRPTDKKTITCTETDSGTITASKNSAALGEKITLTASPAEGYIFYDAAAFDEYNNPVVIENCNWYSPEKPSFTMPYSNLEVKPSFTNILESPKLSITAVPDSSIDAVIPKGVKSFQVTGGNENSLYTIPVGTSDITVQATVYNVNLENTSTLSASSLLLTESVTINCSAVNGFGDYQYAVYCKQAVSDTWVAKQKYGANSTVVFTPAHTGQYEICVKVMDSRGVIVKKYFTLEVSCTLENNSSISADTINYGEKFKISCAAEKGAGGYEYAVYCKQAASDTWVVKQDYSTNSSIYFKPAHTGKYDICVKVRDSSGVVVKKYFKPEVKSTLVNTSTVSADTIGLGESVTINASAEKGTGGYQYAVYFRKSTEENWTTLQELGTNTVLDFKPDKGGVYELSVNAVDSDGNTVKKCFTLNVKAPLENTSTISSDKITLGETLIVNAAAEGGEGDYQYQVYYKVKDAAEWKLVQRYSTNDVIKIKPTEFDSYELCVRAKDSAEKIEKKYFDFTVDNTLKNTSKLSSDTVAVGQAVTINASAIGGDGSYQYEMFYKNSNSSTWIRLQNYSTNASASFTPNNAGSYNVCVKAKDGTGKIEKAYFTVNVE